MKIAYWNNLPAPYIAERLNRLRERGLDVSGVFTTRTAPDRSWEVDEENWVFPYFYLGEDGRHLPWSTLVGLRALREFDVVVGLANSVETVLALHYLRRFSLIALWVAPSVGSWVEQSRLKDAFKQTIYSRVDGILTTGQTGVEFARRLGARNDRIYPIGHPVNARSLSQSALSEQGKKDLKEAVGVTGPVILYLGRIWRGKGVDLLLDAFCLLVDSWNCASPAPSLVFVGDGPDRRSLEKAATNSRHSDRIRFIRHIPYSDIGKWHSLATVHCLPSRGDPYGLVIDEALSLGIRVVASDVIGEVKQRIEHVPGCELFRTGDAMDLARALEASLIDADRRAGNDSAIREGVPQTLNDWCEAFESAIRAITIGSC